MGSRPVDRYPGLMDWLPNVIRDNLAEVGLSAAIVVAVFVVRMLVLRAVIPRLESDEATFRVRKTSRYAAVTVAIIGLGSIWLSQLGGIGSYIGILSAGIAIALSDVLKNLAGWVYIMLRRPFKPGDRVEIGDHAGDVIDIRLFRFSLLEIRNWIDADQSTGRILHIPNGMLFTHAAANFTEGFPFIWHEVPVTVTFESDWERAREIVQAVIDEHAPDPEAAGAVADLERASEHYFIRYRHLTPTVYVRALDSGVQLTGRLLVPARQRRGVDTDVWTGILRAFSAEASVELAYPTLRTYRTDRESGEDQS